MRAPRKAISPHFRPTSCKVCASSDRGRIEFLMARGAGRRSISKQFNISDDSIYRHWHNHLPAHAKAALAASSLKPGTNVADLEQLVTTSRAGYWKICSASGRSFTPASMRRPKPATATWWRGWPQGYMRT
jgi:hypothetical protein